MPSPPKGMPRVIPYLLYLDVAKAIEWLSLCLGFEERTQNRMSDTDGSVRHAEMAYLDGVVLMGCPSPDYKNPTKLGGTTQSLYIYVDNVEAHFERAKASGAEIFEEPADQPYGERRYGAVDPEGHRWYFAQPLD